ncbi:MAG: SRPBCC domain-containing protein, partial [Antricoccus sp.]
MLLRHSAIVNGDVDSVFKALTDASVVAECLSEAKLQAVDGKGFSGTFAVRLGPLRLNFSGTGRLSGNDAARRQVTIRARGRDHDHDSDLDLRLITRCVDDDGARLCFSAELDIRGKAAVLGKGFVVEQFSQIVEDFAA